MEKIKYFPEFDVKSIPSEKSTLLTTYTHRRVDGYWYDIVHRYKYVKNDFNTTSNISDLEIAQRFLTQVNNGLNIPLTNTFVETMNLKPYIKPYDQY